MANLDDARCEVPVSKRNRHFNTEGRKQGLKPSLLWLFTARLKPCPDTKHQSRDYPDVRSCHLDKCELTGATHMIRPEMAVNNMESGDPSIVVSWRTAEFAAEKAPFGVEDVPQRLEPDSLQGIYVRAEGRTLQGAKGVPFRA
jgi:hypothetical protein